MTCQVLSTADQHELYAGLVAAVRGGGSCAVIDPTWPAPLRRRATAAVRAAAERGDVPPGHLVLLTSGSGGQARAVLRTVESWRASLDPLTRLTGLTAADRVWLPGPLWSSLFLYAAFHAGSLGAELVFRDDDPGGATALHCVPTMIQGLVDRRLRGDLADVRLLVVAGDRLDGELRRRATDQGWQVVEYYGATELSFVGWRPDDEPFRPFPGVEVRVVGGEIWARSPYLAVGYLDDARGPLRRDGEWATVGDLGEDAEEGFVVHGRGEQAVNVGGHTVVVGDVEEALRRVDGVRDVAVVGLPHPRLGQQLVAVVVGEVPEERLRAAAADLPAPSRPRRFARADALPRTEAGKLRRRELLSLVQG